MLKKIDELANTKHDASDRTDKLKVFARKFAERAFRSPLSDEESTLLIDKQFAENTNPEEAILRLVLLTLKSPRFLYREIVSRANPIDGDAALLCTLGFTS